MSTTGQPSPIAMRPGFKGFEAELIADRKLYSRPHQCQDKQSRQPSATFLKVSPSENFWNKGSLFTTSLTTPSSGPWSHAMSSTERYRPQVLLLDQGTAASQGGMWRGRAGKEDKLNSEQVEVLTSTRGCC